MDFRLEINQFIVIISRKLRCENDYQKSFLLKCQKNRFTIQDRRNRENEVFRLRITHFISSTI